MTETPMKLVVDCGAYGAPPQEHIDKLKEEALKLLEAGEPVKAANIMQQVTRAQEARERPVEQLVELTEEELAQREKDTELEHERQIAQARAERNSLLAASDWSQLEDSPVKRDTAWLAYRQALRDLDYSDPYNIEWPEAPGGGNGGS